MVKSPSCIPVCYNENMNQNELSIKFTSPAIDLNDLTLVPIIPAARLSINSCVDGFMVIGTKKTFPFLSIGFFRLSVDFKCIINYTFQYKKILRRECRCMKIEKISENQIRCTLNKADLSERHLKISELAYGSDKAKELFRDMMEQANIDFGFDADNIPLMIEAIPTSKDSIVLLITKVDNPDDMDAKLDRFGLSDLDASLDDGLEEDNEEDSVSPDIIDCFEQLHELMDEAHDKETGEFIPLSEAIQKKKKKKQNKKKKDEELRDQMRVYSFASMDPLLPLARLLENEYSAKNTLWKNRMNSRYFLLINRGNSKSGFEQACFRLSEYGREEHITYATEAYYNEHFQLILKDHALRELAEI